MVAFMSWYSIPPLVDYIAEELDISSIEVYDSNVVAVAATISKESLSFHSSLFQLMTHNVCLVARLVVGPLCERFGPRRVMAIILISGAIPCAMTGLLKNAGGLISIR